MEKLKQAFIPRHLGVKSTTPYVLLLLETGCRPIEVHAMIRVLKYINRIRLMDDLRMPKHAWDASFGYRNPKKQIALNRVDVGH